MIDDAAPRSDRASASVCWLLAAAFLLTAAGQRGLPGATAADDTVVAQPGHWYAFAGEGIHLIDYDLAAACEENARKRDAGQAFNYACFLLRDFMNSYHPDTEFTWQRVGNRSGSFVGTRKPDNETLQEVFVRWQSFSDGLQWGFTETEITRRLGADPFAIVADADARARIRSAIGPDAASHPCDVFVRRTREVMTDSGNIVFPPADLSDERYGVFVDGDLRFFTPAGEPLADANRR